MAIAPTRRPGAMPKILTEPLGSRKRREGMSPGPPTLVLLVSPFPHVDVLGDGEDLFKAVAKYARADARQVNQGHGLSRCLLLPAGARGHCGSSGDRAPGPGGGRAEEETGRARKGACRERGLGDTVRQAGQRSAKARDAYGGQPRPLRAVQATAASRPASRCARVGDAGHAADGEFPCVEADARGQSVMRAGALEALL